MDDKVSFLAFCNLCEHLNRLGKIEQKKQKLIGFIEEWRRDDPGSLYSFIRLLLPHVRFSFVCIRYILHRWIMKEKITD